MTKRFTDTDKWKKNWFLDLEPEGKLIWLFVLDYCDNAGVCEFSPKIYSMCVGFKVTREKIDELIGKQIKWISENRFLISDFALFQYGALNPNNNAHKSVIEKLSQIEFIEDSGAAQPLRCPSGGDQDKDKDKDKEMDMVKEKEKEQETEKEKENKNIINLEPVYQAYPRKLGRKDGITKLQREIKTGHDLDQLQTAVKNYSAHVTAKAKDPEYVMHFSTFASRWRDWINPDPQELTPVCKSFAKKTQDNLLNMKNPFLEEVHHAN